MNNEPVYTEIYKGLTINIYPDSDPLSPQEWENDDCFLVYNHRQFSVERNGFNPEDIFTHSQETKKKTFEGYWYFPVYAYIHSGVCLSVSKQSYPFTDRFDVSDTGFCMIQRKKGWSWTKEKAFEIALEIINEWNDYLSGNVYGFLVEDEEGNHIDSCHGFYGDYEEDCLPEARSAADHAYNNRIKARLVKVKQCIKNHVPLSKRAELLPAF
jgi:hypothetical protein